MFQRTSDDMGGTSLIGKISLSPVDLVAALGVPDYGDEYKVSGEYAFSGPDNERFTLYDWKATAFYDSDCIQPEQFWESDEPQTFNIGGDSGIYLDEFKQWLQKQVQVKEATKIADLVDAWLLRTI